MFRHLLLRVCLKRPSWVLTGFLMFYVYVVVRYFLGPNRYRVEEYDGSSDFQKHPIHEHLIGKFPEGFQSWVQVMEYRRERYNKALNRPKNIDGPGEDGEPVVLTPEEQVEADKLFARETFNVIASNKVAMDRRIPDVRPPDCLAQKYREVLPTTSVVIIFCNEAPSAILRTVHSVINRTPPEYLHEIILIDDVSDRADVGVEFEKHIKATWPDDIVKLIRSTERLGLIRARLAGADAATGDVLIFLDAHCEVNVFWVEPVLHRIATDRTIVICPMTDAINDKTLKYSRKGGLAIGGFTWGLDFTWRDVPEREQKRRQSEADPARTPSMTGSMFAVDRKYFYEIGAYDRGMHVWGGENLELPFRAWMCGGSVEILPCSRIGHIFRRSHPYVFNVEDSHGVNSKRLAEVWMDEYKRLFYMQRKDLVDKDVGNFTDRIELRKRLQCKSFKWFLENVYPEKFIPDENVYAYGMVRNPSSNICLDTLKKKELTANFELGLFLCQDGNSVTQVFSLSLANELRREEVCADSTGVDGTPVMIMHCHGQHGNQEWKHDRTTGTIVHVPSNMCLDRAEVKSGGSVIVRPCTGVDSQKWEFEHYMNVDLRAISKLQDI